MMFEEAELYIIRKIPAMQNQAIRSNIVGTGSNPSSQSPPEASSPLKLGINLALQDRPNLLSLPSEEDVLRSNSNQSNVKPDDKIHVLGEIEHTALQTLTKNNIQQP